MPYFRNVLNAVLGRDVRRVPARRKQDDSEAYKYEPSWLYTYLENTKDTLNEPMAQHSYVYACIRAIMQRCASVPFRLYNGEREVTAGPWSTRLEKPNGFWTTAHLWEMTTALLMLKGNALWLIDKRKPSDEPGEIWVFDHERFSPVFRKGTRKLLFWEWEFNRRKPKKRVMPWQVGFFHLSNPHHANETIFGLAPMDAAMLPARQDWFASNFNEAFFRNSANPGGVLSIKEQIDEESYEALKSQFRSEQAGFDNSFKTLFLRGEVDYKPLEVKYDQLEYDAGRKFRREEICGIFHVPPSEVGIFEQVHKATSAGLQKQFWEGTIKPLLTLYQAVLKAQVFPFSADVTHGEFDLSGVEALQEDRTKKVDRAGKVFGMGAPFYLVNEVEGLGYPRFEGDDVGYLAVNMRPLDVPFVMPGTTAGGGANGNGEAAVAAPEPQRAITAPYRLLPKGRKAIDINSDEHVEYLANYYEALAPAMMDFKKALRTYLIRVRSDVLQRLIQAVAVHGVAGLPEAALDISPALDEALVKLAGRHYKRVADAIGPAIEREINEIPNITYGFESGSGRIAEYLKTKKIRITEINKRMRQSIRDTLVDVQARGGPLTEIQEGVVDVIGDQRSRALTIARTETVQAAGGVKYNAELEAGVTLHQWVAQVDEKTRDAHLENMALGPWPVRKRFPDGSLYPGDVTNPNAANVINCRCAIYAAG